MFINTYISRLVLILLDLATWKLIGNAIAALINIYHKLSEGVVMRCESSYLLRSFFTPIRKSRQLNKQLLWRKRCGEMFTRWNLRSRTKYILVGNCQNKVVHILFDSYHSDNPIRLPLPLQMQLYKKNLNKTLICGKNKKPLTTKYLYRKVCILVLNWLCKK